MNRDDTLATAANLIRGDRHSDYGDFTVNAKRLAEMWTAYLDGKMPDARDIAPMLCMLKLMRLRNGPHEDSWVDLAGYAGLGSEVDD